MRPRRSGVILIITLLALVLLAALVMYVFNLGQQINTRRTVQDSVDAAAQAGAGWIARSLNTVAMNNVAIARHIALVNVLDGLPQATAYTLLDQEALADAVGGQLGRPIRGFWVRDGLAVMRDEVEQELEWLRPMDTLFTAHDVTDLTFFEGHQGRGRLWRAMQALDDFSTATMQHLTELAPASADQAGLLNLNTTDTVGDLVMVPVLPRVPWQRGRFEDFKRPVTEGLLPEPIDDRKDRRGPWDAVFGWREPVGGTQDGYWVPGSTQVVPGSGPNVPSDVGRGARSRGRFVRTNREPEAYRVYGPLRWMLRQISHFTWSRMRHSRLGWWTRRITDAKVKFLWPDDQTARLSFVTEPDYVTSFTEALDLARSDPSRIKETVFVAIEVKSRTRTIRADNAGDGSWAYVEEGVERSPRVIRLRGWRDPRRWGIPRITRYIWEDQWEYESYFDHQIGIAPQFDPEGNPVAQPVYRIDNYMFVAVNIGEPVRIRDPHNFDSYDQLAAPIDLDHDIVTPDPISSRHHLTYLAVGQVDDHPVMWSDRFQGGKPYPHIVAVAQARVFNNHSWDLWTQMWHAQLERVQSYETWVEQMGTDGAAAQLANDNPETIDDLYRYLRSTQSLARMMLSH